MKFVKTWSICDAHQESFKVYAGSTLLFTASNMTTGVTYISEQCLMSSTNNQYTLELLHSTGGSWESHSYLTIYGKYGNVIFKNYMTYPNKETYTISLYYGIEQDAIWKMISGSAAIGWTDYSFSDSAWMDATLGSVTATTVSGTQYFRKQFVGLSDMAAYDVRLYYKAGVIAYINGIEVYRDNLPEGEVSASTTATGEYPEINYHGFIRPGSEVASQQSILAVEIHLNSVTQATVDFNAYLAILAASIREGNCFIYAKSTYGTPLSSYSDIFDFSKSSSYSVWSVNLPITATFTSMEPKAMINAVRIWPDITPSFVPKEFSWQGSHDNQQWTDVIIVSEASYNSQVYQSFYGYFNTSLYPYYRANFIRSSSDYMEIYEFQPLICSISIPTTIPYTPNKYTFLANYEEVYIRPDLYGFTSCTAQNLPEDLVIDATTCLISGMAHTTVSDLEVIVTSTTNGNTYTGSFTLTIQDCPGTMLNVLRAYSCGSYNEAFYIKDVLTQEVIVSIPYGSEQRDDQNITTTICVTGSTYEVTVWSNIRSWCKDSFLYVRAILSGDEMETILRMRYDSHVGFPATRTMNVQYLIPTHSNWYYKHGEVPLGWYSSTSTEEWTEGNDTNFPDSSNQIQLYKKSFTVADISNITAFVLSIKFKYGCIVYLNGHEAFRKGLADATISSMSYADNTYADALYHQISLPITTLPMNDVDAINYIQQGLNTIAIGIVAANINQKEAIFDCALRLMDEVLESRVFDYTVTSYGISGDVSYIFNHYYDYSIYSSSCTDNYLNIAFNNDRHEWINHVTILGKDTQISQQVRQFTLKARSGNDEWTTLITVSDSTWFQSSPVRTISFTNNIAYHEYRFENFGSDDSSNCNWNINTIDLGSMSTTITIPELVYESIRIFTHVKMEDVYPNSEYYSHFRITPFLPRGLSLDPVTGIISGTAKWNQETTTFSITANKLTGGISTANFSITIDDCTVAQSLVTLVVLTDNFCGQSSFKLFQGIGTSGTLIQSNDQFEWPFSLHHTDFCLENGIYTLELFDSASDGWDNPAGYYLTVDKGEMIIEMGQVPSGVASVSTMFSSYLPFQMENTEWKISYEYVMYWNTLDFDDSDWWPNQGVVLVYSMTVAYIRKEVDIPDIDIYSVLNVRIKYNGGVAAYFNGNIVARFNLEENADSQSSAIALHDINSCSFFHVILNSVSGVNGKNIMAFEMHRYMNDTYQEQHSFDATGVFGLNECSIVADSYELVTGTNPLMGSLSDLLELNFTSYGYLPNTVGTFFDWKVENLEGTRFNAFGMQTVYARENYGFSLSASSYSLSSNQKILEVSDQTLKELGQNHWPIPQGVFGFKQFRFEVDAPASDNVYVSSYMFLFCKPRGSSICPGIDGFASVGKGEYSLGDCGYGYYGNTYRICSNGQLGDIHTENCIQRPPANLQYEHSFYVFVTGTKVYIRAPLYMNIIEEFYSPSGSSFPVGLSLNSTTGEIHGVPTEYFGFVITIFGRNQVGVTNTSVRLFFRKGECQEDGEYPTTDVGDVIVYECREKGPYVGKLKRACLLGEKDGEWDKVRGICMSYSSIYVIVVVIIVLIIPACWLVSKYIAEKKKANKKNGKPRKISSSRNLPIRKKGVTRSVPVQANSRIKPIQVGGDIETKQMQVNAQPGIKLKPAYV